ncbi:TPA: LamG domain-containing protein [Candidatus Poribacteria bacterium]|nr:LamG domain-containing protein [Candidatus Poribacteria bacterium]
MPFPFPFTMFGANRSSNTPSGVTCDFTYCYGGDWVQGKVGNYGMNFGVTDPDNYVTIPTATDIEFGNTDSFSVSFWVSSSLVSGDPGVQGFVSKVKYTGGSGQYGWVVGRNDASDTGAGSDNEFVFSLRHDTSGGGFGYIYSNSVVDDGWHHVVCTRNSNNTNGTIMYIDGVAQSDTSMVGGTDPYNLTDSSDPLYLGRWWHTNQAAPIGLTGSLDEVALWDVVLTQTEVTALYNSGSGERADSITPPEVSPGVTGSLLLYYDFEIGDNNPVSGNFPTSTTVYDVDTVAWKSPTMHTGTMTNMSVADFGAWSQGKIGKYSLEFEYNTVADSRTTSLQGTYVDIGGTATDFAADQAFSIVGWVKPAYGGSEADRCMILANNSGDPATTSQQNNGWYVMAYQKTLYFFFGESGWNFITKATDAAVLDTTDWIHFVVTYDGTELNSGMNIYIDGSSETSTGGSNGTFAGQTVDYTYAQLRLAGRNWGNSLFHRFPGNMDEISIWSGSLSQTNITSLAAGAKANAITASAGSAVTGSWVSGKLDDYSLQFGNGPTGANARHTDSVEIPYTSSMEFTTQDFSIGCWVKVHATQTYQGIVSNDISSGGYKGWLLGTVAAGQFTFSTRHPSYGVAYTYSAIQSNVDTEWHHVVAVRDGIYNRLYVNGTAAITPTTMTSIADNGSIPYRLGQWWENNDNLSGQCDLDEVGVWNVALDPGAIDELYNSGDGVLSNTVSSSNLVAYYNMEDGPGNGTLTDRTGNGNNGTLTNMNDGTAAPPAATLVSYYDMECDGPGSNNVLDLSGNSVSGTLINADTGSCGSG